MTKLQRARRDAGLTIRQLADKMPVSFSTLSRVERGLQSANAELVVALCAYFPDITPAYLARLGAKR